MKSTSKFTQIVLRSYLKTHGVNQEYHWYSCEEKKKKPKHQTNQKQEWASNLRERERVKERERKIDR